MRVYENVNRNKNRIQIGTNTLELGETLTLFYMIFLLRVRILHTNTKFITKVYWWRCPKLGSVLS